MTLDVENGIPVITIIFGKSGDNEIYFLCHIDTCAAIYTVKIILHQWIIIKYPHLVA